MWWKHQINVVYVTVMSYSRREQFVITRQQSVKCCSKTNWNGANYQSNINLNSKNLKCVIRKVLPVMKATAVVQRVGRCRKRKSSTTVYIISGASPTTHFLPVLLSPQYDEILLQQGILSPVPIQNL